MAVRYILVAALLLRFSDLRQGTEKTMLRIMRAANCYNIQRNVQNMVAKGYLPTACNIGRARSQQNAQSLFSKQFFCSAAADVAEVPTTGKQEFCLPVFHLPKVFFLGSWLDNQCPSGS